MSKNYLTEAFQDLKVLDEEVFDVTDKGISELKDFKDKDEIDNTISIIDPEAETEEDIQDSYVGKVILDCCVCHSKIYKDKEDVIITEDGESANVDEECPFCYSSDGFKVIGEVTEYDPSDVSVNAEKDGKKAGTEVKVDGDIVDDDKKDKVEEKLSVKPIRRAYKKVTEADDTDESLGSWIAAKKLQKMDKKGLKADATDAEKKAFNDKRKGLRSLAKAGAEYKTSNGKANATQKVLNQVDKANRFKASQKGLATIKSKKQSKVRDDLKAKLGISSDEELNKLLKSAGLIEGLDSIKIDTGDQEIEVMATDKVNKNEKTETIAPLNPDTKAEIETNVQDIDVDEFDEENFDELGEAYLKKSYGNVESYKTSKASSLGNQLKLEGIIKFKSGKEKKTNFIFESKDITKKGKARFIGEHAQICRGRKAFTVVGTLANGKFLPESLSYNYRVKDAKSGVSQRVNGTVSIKNK